MELFRANLVWIRYYISECRRANLGNKLEYEGMIDNRNSEKCWSMPRKKEIENGKPVFVRDLLGNQIRVVISPESEHHRLPEHDTLL